MKKTYHVTGYAYVPVDADVLATSKKEAKEKYLEGEKNNELGFDYELRIHEVTKQEVLSSEKELVENNGVVYTYGDYFLGK